MLRYLILPILGIIIPVMGNIGIAEALFSKTQQRLYSLLFGQPDRTYFLNELIKEAKIGRGTVQREMEKLVASGLVLVKKVGNQKHYQANKGSPVFEELAGILRKTAGLVEVLANALVSLEENIDVALVFGSMASDKATSASDVDLLVIGDVEFSRVAKAVYPSQEILKREINPKVYTQKEWKKLIAKQDGFVKQVMKQPKLFIIGTKDELG